MQNYTYICWIHTDAMNNRRRKTSLQIFTSHFIARVRKGCVGFYCERELEIEHNCNILTPHSYGRHVVSFLFSWCSTRGLGAHSAGWSATSYQQLLRSPNSIGVPEGPLGRVWLSLPHLISSWLGTPTQLNWPELNSTGTGTQLAQLSYIIIRCPLDLWNRMFNRHQAEITVMQFRGHSLPVHQSMSVPWEFFLAHPISSANFRPHDFLFLTAIRMCHLLPVHHLGMAFLAGSKSQNITIGLQIKNDLISPYLF